MFFIFLICAIELNASSVDKALAVVHQADSLRSVGVLYTDSAKLSMAVNLLRFRRHKYANEYAKANYYYGRFMLSHEHPVEAMECFIRVIESKTNDYEILGRTYSNMSVIALKENNYEMAFKLDSLSSLNFKKGGMSLNYLYALNLMAYSKAKMKEKNDALNILDSISNKSDNLYFRSKIFETKSVMYLEIAKYDSALYNINKVQEIAFLDEFQLQLKAQIFSYLSQKDSAVLYAARTLKMSDNTGVKINMYYILSNDDSSISIDSLLVLASLRADAQKQQEMDKLDYAKAGLLCTQHLENNSKNKLHIALLIFLSLLFILISFYSIVIIKKRIENLRLYSEVEKMENRQKIIVANIKREINLFVSDVCNRGLYDSIRWNDFDKMKEIVDIRLYGFVTKLCNKYSLSEIQIRLCILVLLNKTYMEMSEILNYSNNGVGKLKYITARKLNTTMQNMQKFLIQIICEI